jgi:hypothetical protein
LLLLLELRVELEFESEYPEDLRELEVLELLLLPELLVELEFDTEDSEDLRELEVLELMPLFELRVELELGTIAPEDLREPEVLVDTPVDTPFDTPEEIPDLVEVDEVDLREPIAASELEAVEDKVEPFDVLREIVADSFNALDEAMATEFETPLERRDPVAA